MNKEKQINELINILQKDENIHEKGILIGENNYTIDELTKESKSKQILVNIY